jgi:pimeloyl-ACP methyl ester carboxylesterase
VQLLTSSGRFELITRGAEGGEVVLCLHGFPDTPVGFAPLLEQLAGAGYFAVAPYMRGYHPSTLEGPFHLDQIADDIIALADALSPAKPVHVVGHDWGAIATYLALQRAPERFARAVTLSVPHPASWLGNLVHCPRQLLLWWYVLFFNLGGFAQRRAAARDFLLVERLWSAWSPGMVPDQAYFAELKRCLGRSGRAPYEYYRALARRGGLLFGNGADPLRTPLLYLHGANDGCVDARMADGQNRWFGDEFEARVLPEAGHFLLLERPAEVTRQVLEWLASPN